MKKFITAMFVALFALSAVSLFADEVVGHHDGAPHHEVMHHRHHHHVVHHHHHAAVVIHADVHH